MTFLEHYWFALLLGAGLVSWGWRAQRRARAATTEPRLPRPPTGSVGPVPFRGADFSARVAAVKQFYSRWIGSMIACIIVGLGVGAAPGISYSTRVAGGIAGGVGAVASLVVLGVREGSLLRRHRLYCPKCGERLVGGGEYEVPAEMIVSATGQCRCGAWIIDPADLPSGQGPDPRYLPGA